LKSFPTSEARLRFHELAKRAEAGEEILISRRGRVVARIVPPSRKAKPRSIIGAMAGQIWLSEDFDQLDAEWNPYIR